MTSPPGFYSWWKFCSLLPPGTMIDVNPGSIQFYRPVRPVLATLNSVTRLKKGLVISNV